jgi:hypothetical protein
MVTFSTIIGVAGSIGYNSRLRGIGFGFAGGLLSEIHGDNLGFMQNCTDINLI